MSRPNSRVANKAARGGDLLNDMSNYQNSMKTTKNSPSLMSRRVSINGKRRPQSALPAITKGKFKDGTTEAESQMNGSKSSRPWTATLSSLLDTPMNLWLDTFKANSWKNAQVTISIEDMKRIYKEKCEDQGLLPTPERESRFIELVHKNCGKLMFCLKENGLGPLAAAVIAEALSKDKHYTLVDLSGNRIRDAGATSIGNMLRVNESIVHVDLRSNDIGPTGGENIFEPLLEDNRSLTSLDLSALSGVNRNHIGQKGAFNLGLTLSRNQVLAILNLSSNGVGPEGIMHLASGLKGNIALTSLDISSNNIGPEGAQYLAEALLQCRVSHLNLERNELGDKGASALSSVIGNPKHHLVSLDLAYNKMKGDGLNKFCQGLGIDRKLRSLRMDGNEVDSARTNMAIAIRENAYLHTLLVNLCSFQEVAGGMIADSLKANNSIRWLEIGSNWMEDKSMKLFGMVLKVNNALKHLDFSGNRIGDEAGVKIVQALKENSSLTSLNLKNNSLRRAGDLLAEIMSYNTTITFLDVSFNDISYRSSVMISDRVKENLKAFKAAEPLRLKERIDTLKLDEEKLEDTKVKIEKEKRKLEADANNEANATKELDSIYEETEKKISQIEANFLEKQKFRKQLAEELDTIRDEVSQVKMDGEMETQSLGARIDRLKNESHHLQAELSKLKEKSSGAEAKIEEEVRDLTEKLQSVNDKKDMAKAAYEREQANIRSFAVAYSIPDHIVEKLKAADSIDEVAFDENAETKAAEEGKEQTNDKGKEGKAAGGERSRPSSSSGTRGKRQDNSNKNKGKAERPPSAPKGKEKAKGKEKERPSRK